LFCGIVIFNRKVVVASAAARDASQMTNAAERRRAIGKTAALKVM